MDLVLSSSQDLHDVRQLAASSGAFAAICGPCGRVVAWGSKSYGGDAGRVQAMIFFSKKKPAVNAMEFGVWWPESFTEGCQRLEYSSYIALKIVL